MTGQAETEVAYMDELDQRIIGLLQVEGRLANASVARKRTYGVGNSPSALPE